MNFDASLCKDGRWLHKYITLDSKYDSVLERCLRCGKKNVIKLVNGVPNNKEYIQHHMREVLFPQHPRFAKEYVR